MNEVRDLSTAALLAQIDGRDALGRPTHAFTVDGQISRAYDQMGRDTWFSAQSDALVDHRAYEYDDLGRASFVHHEDAEGIWLQEFVYENPGRLTHDIRSTGTGTTVYAWDAAGNRTSITKDGGATTISTYDSARCAVDRCHARDASAGCSAVAEHCDPARLWGARLGSGKGSHDGCTPELEVDTDDRRREKISSKYDLRRKWRRDWPRGFQATHGGRTGPRPHFCPRGRSCWAWPRLRSFGPGQPTSRLGGHPSRYPPGVWIMEPQVCS